MNDEHDLKVILRSRFPLVVVESFEELRVLELLERVANLEDRPLFVWTLTEGLRRRSRPDSLPETRDPPDVLRHIHSTPQNGVYVLVDFHPFLNDPVHQRYLKTIAQDHGRSQKTLVFLSPRLELPADLSRMAARFQMAMPDLAAIRALVKTELDDWQFKNDARVQGHQEALDMLLQLLVGMSEDDARRLVRQAIYDDGAITIEDTARVLKQKHEAMGADAVLSLELDVAKWDDVAGLANLKRWLDQRRNAFTGELRGLEAPRGVMLLGVQGSGKSLAARAVAGAWRVPLMRLDFGVLYSKWIGETERNLREALRSAERMAPCVLWIDEIEKGISQEAGDNGEGGVSRRMLGTLLTWMAERTSRVFLVATANAIEQLPPELIRKGRIDEIFFVDLPDAATRADVVRIHLKRRSLDPAAFDVAALGDATAGFSGAEIEQAIVAALFAAHAAGEPLGTAHVLAEAKATRPLSVIAAEKIEALRFWARDRAVMA
ncbi:MAG: AAA family ATPase [Burkholderiales bacterium]|nr:AAA family ATPase [Burkholderiales bacterium]